MRVFKVLALSFVLFGCGQANFTGTFVGNAGVTRGPSAQEQLTFNLVQNGSAFTGSWTSSLGPSGSVTGTSNGSALTSFQMTIPSTAGSCAGSLNGTGTYNNYILTMQLTGQTQCGIINQTITLTKTTR